MSEGERAGRGQPWGHSEEWLFVGPEVPLRRTDPLDTPACSV
jgi:hypothetical protein